jgi:hypothetical protein
LLLAACHLYFADPIGVQMAGYRSILLMVAVLATGCANVERKMTIETDPPGALVMLNNQEAGRTPFTREFTWYGNYDVQIRKEGYESVKTNQWVVAPIWQWVPFDLVAELFPIHLKDHHTYRFELEPAATVPLEEDDIITRAQGMRGELQSSRVK